MKARLAAILVFAAGVAFCPPAGAGAKSASGKELGRFGVWQAYAAIQGGQTVCYMVTTKTAPAARKARPYLMITHRPVEASTDVFSYDAGLPLDSGRGAVLRVGAASFDLFTVGDMAWSRDAVTDHKIAAAIVAAAAAQVAGFSGKRNARILDVFALAGAGGAYRAIGKACGVPPQQPRS